MQFFQFALSVPLHLKYGVLNGVGTDFPLVNGNSQGIDQERHVWMKNENDGVGGLPAIAFEVRIEHGHRGFLGGPFLKKLPSREDSPIGIGKSSTYKFFKRNVSIMLLREFTDLFRFGFRYFFSESFVQLLENCPLLAIVSAFIVDLCECEINVIGVPSHKHSQSLDFCPTDAKTAASTYANRLCSRSGHPPWHYSIRLESSGLS